MVVVVMVTWQSLKGRDGGQLKVPFAHMHFRHKSQRSSYISPTPKTKTKELSAARQKLSVEHLSILVLEHLHCKSRTSSLGFSSLGNSSMQATEETLQLCENHSPSPLQVE